MMNFSDQSYPFPSDGYRIKCIDMHTGGEPLRVVLEGYPSLEGNSILEYRQFVQSKYDHLRKCLMWEPRGHADMYGLLLTPSREADFGVLFMHNEGYSTMCGHAIIAIARLAVECGWVALQEPETSLLIEAPCGLIRAFVGIEDGKYAYTRFLNVPSFVLDLDAQVEVEGLGKINYDLAYGGAFYAFVDATALKLDCIPENYPQFIQYGKSIKKAVQTQRNDIQHPREADLSFLYGTIFIGGPISEGVDSRNVCVFAEGEVDRSPTGSGVSARAAIHQARGEMKRGERKVIESILGTQFEVRIQELVDFVGIPSVIPEVKGQAYVTGKSEFYIDPNDPLREGFIFR